MNQIQLLGFLDINPIIESMIKHDDLWGNFPERSEYENSSHKNTDCLVLRTNCSRRPEDFQSQIESEWIVDAGYEIELICDLLKENLNGSDIGRVMFTSLFPNSEISEHVDTGVYAESTIRIHIPVISNKNVSFTVGDEEVNMLPGAVYKINHLANHSVRNNSDEERIHLIIDIVR